MLEPGGLPSMGLHRVRHDRSDLAAAAETLVVISSDRIIPACHHPQSLPSTPPRTGSYSELILPPFDWPVRAHLPALPGPQDQCPILRPPLLQLW